MSAAIRSDPKLWLRVKTAVHTGSEYGPAGTWNARKAQYAVKRYKELGGLYVGAKSKKNALSKWTREDWGYIDGKPGNRYLPKGIRKSLTSTEKVTENRLKRASTKKKKQKAKYSASVLVKMQNR